MNIVEWSKGVVKRFRWYDVKLAQLSTLFATLCAMVLWQGFREFVFRFEWYWYLILAIIFGLPLVKRMFFEG